MRPPRASQPPLISGSSLSSYAQLARLLFETWDVDALAMLSDPHVRFLTLTFSPAGPYCAFSLLPVPLEYVEYSTVRLPNVTPIHIRIIRLYSIQNVNADPAAKRNADTHTITNNTAVTVSLRP